MRDILHITSSSSSKSLSKLRRSAATPTRAPPREPLKETVTTAATGPGATAAVEGMDQALTIKFAPKRSGASDQRVERQEFKNFDPEDEDTLGELVIAQKVIGKALARSTNSPRVLRSEDFAIRPAGVPTLIPTPAPATLPATVPANPVAGANAFTVSSSTGEDQSSKKVQPRRPDKSSARAARQQSVSSSSPPSPSSERSGSPFSARNGASSIGSAAVSATIAVPPLPTTTPTSPVSPMSTTTAVRSPLTPTAGPSRSRTSTSYASLKDAPGTTTLVTKHSSREQLLRHERRATNTYKPKLPNASVKSAPAACLYWSKAPVQGHRFPPQLRAHTASLINDSIYVFGGCGPHPEDAYNDVWRLDVETFWWQKVKCDGDIPPPCKSHTATVVDGSMYILAGGAEESYYTSDLYIFDPVRATWKKPKVYGQVPCPRRAHATVLYGKQLVVFGGGDGDRALNDLHALDVSNLNSLDWRRLDTAGKAPDARGYHTAQLCVDKLVVFGGVSGEHVFADLHVLDLNTLEWSAIDLETPVPRKAFSATSVGSCLFIIGGNNGEEYCNEVRILNLSNLQWEPRPIHGQAPPPVGYHTATLTDSRIIVLAGCDGHKFNETVYTLDLAAAAFYPQVTKWRFGDCVAVPEAEE